MYAIFVWNKHACVLHYYHLLFFFQDIVRHLKGITLLVGLSVCVQQLAACPLPEETDKEKGGVTEERIGERRGRGVMNMDDKLHNSR